MLNIKFSSFAVIVLLGGLYSAQSVNAMETDIVLTNIETVAVVGPATGGHIAGNMEISVKTPLTLPANMKCDKTYLTTKKVVDPDRAMLTLLLKNQGTARPVRLRITDDPAYTAYTGRCSILIVDIK
jgi:hypothetical protein